MSGVVDAHAKLLAIAEAGPEYRRDQVFHVDPDATDGADIVGRGRDFEKPVQVLDRDSAPTIAGRAALRLLGMRQPDGSSSLFLRSRLDWETEAGKHSSSAAYLISSAGALSLAEAAQDPTPEPTEAEVEAMLAGEDGVQRAFEMIGDAMGDAAQYGGQWTQTFPGSDAAWGDFKGFDDGKGNPDWPAIQASDDYHQRAVRAAKEAEPDLLTMLSDTEFGGVAPEELPALLSWVEQNSALATN